MTNLVEIVRSKIKEKCIANRCKKDGCSVSLKCAPRQRLIIDFDKPGSPLGQADKRCDYLFVANESTSWSWLVPLELKKSKVDAKEVIEQLKAGADISQKLVPRHIEVNFRPIVAHRGIRKAERDELKKPRNRIRFRNLREYVRLINCGDKLNKELSRCLEERKE